MNVASERRARYLQDQLNAVIRNPGWRFLRGCRDFLAIRLLGRFPRCRKMLGVLLRKGPGGVIRCLRERSFGDHKYEEFLSKHALTEQEIGRLNAAVAALSDAQRPLISIIFPVYNTPREPLQQALASVRKQLYANWELCVVDNMSTLDYVRPLLEQAARDDPRIRVHFRDNNGNICRSSQDALDMARGPFVALMDSDDVITPDALAQVVLALTRHPDADVLYSDHDLMLMNGRRVGPFFKPDWSPDMFLSNMYVCHLTVFRTELVRKIGGFRVGLEGSQDYDMVLRLEEQTQARKIVHIPQVLYSWRRVPGSTAHRYDAKPFADVAARRALTEALQRRGIEGTVESGLMPSLFRIRRKIRGEPLVSILIPFRDRAELLARCLESIRARTSYRNYELLLIDNGSRTPEMARCLDRVRRAPVGRVGNSPYRVKVLRVDEPFNYSRLNNLAARQAAGEHLLLLNNDTEALADEWLSAMLEHSQRPEVGAVGAKLLYPDGRVQHAGVVMGIGEVAGHAHRMAPDGSPGYYGCAAMIRNVSAVTGACMMTRRALFLELGGLNETELAVAYNDVDYCLRLREKGFLIVYTPYARLRHYESATRGFANNPRESAYMCRRWPAALQDPYYNPNLNQSAEDFSLAL